MSPPTPSGDAATVAQAAQPDIFARANARLAAQRPLRKPHLRTIAADLKRGDLDSADRELTRHLSAHPDDADALLLAARAAAHGGARTKAVLLLARCLEHAPDFAAARFEYAKMLLRVGKFRAALGEVDRLLAGDSDNPLFLRLKAGILATIGRDADSLAIWEDLVARDPQRPESRVMHGHALRAMGLRDKSIAAYRQAIALRPSLGLAWWSLANMKTVRFDADDIAAMRDILQRPDIAVDDRIDILASLGKAYEDLGRYDASFEHYARANATRRLRIDYDWDEIASVPARNKALFVPDFLRSRRGAGCPAPDPIFVLGRPRSGSTLIEQMLASHSAIEGTGELPYIAGLARRIEEGACVEFATPYPEVLEKLDPSALARLGEEYLEDARAHRRLGRPFFVDKSPNNYFHIGLILLILPNAKIVDARRHPAACCLSMFKQKFEHTNLRLSELGRVYRDYVEIVAHFDSVLPGRIHRVIYEDMVANPEAEIRKLTDYLGLPFEDASLRFHEADRTVRTPSSEQVRRPISPDAVDHWRHYEPWLGPLAKSLGSVLEHYPNVPEELR